MKLTIIDSARMAAEQALTHDTAIRAREQMHFTPVCIIIASVIGADAAASVALFGGGLLATGIIDSDVMIFACLTGAIGGSIFSLAITPPKRPTIQSMAWKFFASGIFSIIFSPALIEWFQPQPQPTFVLAVSGLLGMTAFSTSTVIRRKWLRWLNGRSVDGEDKDE